MEENNALPPNVEREFLEQIIKEYTIAFKYENERFEKDINESLIQIRNLNKKIDTLRKKIECNKVFSQLMKNYLETGLFL